MAWKRGMRGVKWLAPLGLGVLMAAQPAAAQTDGSLTGEPPVPTPRLRECYVGVRAPALYVHAGQAGHRPVVETALVQDAQVEWQSLLCGTDVPPTITGMPDGATDGIYPDTDEPGADREPGVSGSR